jgi:SAM-dependent methyltransferase
MLKAIGMLFSRRARLRRGRLLHHCFPDLGDRNVLDLGGGDGQHVRMILPDHGRITVADISSEDLRCAKNAGFETVVIDGTNRLPFETKGIDFIFCSSVIEHITIPKNEIWSIENDDEFERRAKAAQAAFAREISRCSRSYFVQTPHKFFPVESHTWLPFFIVFLRRALQIQTIRLLNRFWLKQSEPDWRLLTFRDMKELFPDAEIFIERIWGVPKSMIAIRR